MPIVQRLGQPKRPRIPVRQWLQPKVCAHLAAEFFSTQDEGMGCPRCAAKDEVQKLLDGRVVGEGHIHALEFSCDVIDEQGKGFLLLHA